MKKAVSIVVATSVVMLSGIAMITGCNDTSGSSTNSSISTANTENKKTKSSEHAIEYSKYSGAWKLKVSGGKELYLITSLEDYFGRTAIDIESVNGKKVKGSISSVQGAPSFRQASVDFEGEIDNGKLIANYKDDNWLYSGNMELLFKDSEIVAKITREKTEENPMWGIPEGKHVFVRPIETTKVDMSQNEKSDLEKFLSPLTENAIKPFADGELTDEDIVKFAGINLAAGFLDASDFDGKIQENGSDVVISETLMNGISEKYFGVKVKQHKSYDAVKYENGNYSVPALGGLAKSTTVQILLSVNSSKNDYYAIVDYMSENPQDDKKLDGEYLMSLRKNGSSYVVKAITKINDPIDFEALNSLHKQ